MSMKTRRIFIKRDDPQAGYFECVTVCTRKLRNTANYIIRNTMSALGKPESERYPSENDVLVNVRECISEANANAIKRFPKQATDIRDLVKKL